jgi:filamentous hemagglutinin
VATPGTQPKYATGLYSLDPKSAEFYRQSDGSYAIPIRSNPTEQDGVKPVESAANAPGGPIIEPTWQEVGVVVGGLVGTVGVGFLVIEAGAVAAIFAKDLAAFGLATALRMNAPALSATGTQVAIVVADTATGTFTPIHIGPMLPGGGKGPVGRGLPVVGVEPPKVNLNQLAGEFQVTQGGNGAFFRYGNPVYWAEAEASHGLNAFIDRSGTLGFDIFSNPEIRSAYGSGSDMFNALMIRAGQEGIEINAIRGAWMKGTDSVNFSQFNQGLANGMTHEQAALNTWTGRMATARGYSVVDSITKDAGNVYVIFKKPL